MNTLYQKSLLKLSDFSEIEINKLIKFSILLKKLKKNKNEKQFLKKKNIVLIFEKESTRTRCAFEVAAFDQGAKVTYLGPNNTHLGQKESIEDTAKILSLYYDGIQYRGYDHQSIKILSQYSTVPIWNGLTNEFHPTQILADLLTIKENLPIDKNISEITCSYIGDSMNNISNTLIEAACLLKFNLRIISPKKYWINQKNLSIPSEYKNISYTDDLKEGVYKTDFIYTDVWVSMGEPTKNWDEKISDLKKFQVNSKLLSFSENPNIKVLHCLPAFHDLNTTVGNLIMKKFNLKNGIEITHEIFQLNRKIIFEQAENKLHTIKALLILTLNSNTSYI